MYNPAQSQNLHRPQNLLNSDRLSPKVKTPLSAPTSTKLKLTSLPADEELTPQIPNTINTSGKRTTYIHLRIRTLQGELATQILDSNPNGLGSSK